MVISRWWGGISGLAFLGLAAAVPGQQGQPDREDSVQAARAVLDRQAADWNRGDLDGFLGGYWNAPKVVFQSGGQRLDGWDALRTRYRHRYQAEGRAMGRLEFSALDLEPLGPQAVLARGRWRLTLPDGTRPGGLFTVIFRKLPEGWKIVHDHTSAEEERPPGAGSQPDFPALQRRTDELVRAELTRDWYPRAVDRQRGGFHQTFARDWSPVPDRDTFLVYQARLTWTAAAFARYSPAHRAEFVGYARHGIVFLDTVMRDKELGGFHWVLDPRGRLDPKLGDEKHVYGIAFVIYAASTVREVIGDEQALQVARDAFDWLEQHAHDAQHGGYFEALRRDGTPIRTWDEGAPIARRVDRVGIYYGFKTMNVHIHLLEALTALSRVDPRPVVKERLRELLGIVRDRIAVEPGALNLYLTPDWRAIPAHDSFGHDVETAYLLVEAAEALGIPDDPKTWAMARRLVDHALDWGWDEQWGGFYDKGESFGAPAWDLKKVWWTEAEGLNALLLMHQKFGGRTDRYLQAFRQQWDFIARHLIDPLHGGWFAETTREGTLLGDGAKANPWKANYHTARALMNVATRLQQLEGDRPGP